jgi:hypothetical protein
MCINRGGRVSDIFVLADTQFDESMHVNKFEDDLKYLKSIYNDAVLNNIKCVFILGDLFERNDRIYASIYSRVFDVVRWAENQGVPTVIIPGNHDLKILNGCVENAIHPFGEPVIEGEVFTLQSHRSRVVWGTAICDINEYSEILCVPYYKDKNALVNSVCAMSIFKPCILLGHFTATQVPIDYMKFDQVLLGHEHNYSRPYDNVRQLGSLYQHSFADEGNEPCRFARVNLPMNATDVVTVEEYFNKDSREFHTFRVNSIQEYEQYLADEAAGNMDDYYHRPSATTFTESLKEKKLLDSTIRTDMDYLIAKYAEDNYKGDMNIEGIKQVGHNVVTLGGKK